MSAQPAGDTSPRNTTTAEPSREAIIDAADRWSRSHHCRDIRFCCATPLDAFEAGWKAGRDADGGGT